MKDLQNNYLNNNNYGENFLKFQKEFKDGMYIPEFFIDHSVDMENDTLILIRDFARILFKNLNHRFISNDVVESFKMFSIKKIRASKKKNWGHLEENL